MTGSLAYRNNEADIVRGEVPNKYTRLLPYITGSTILEFGSAEGVLACLLAREGSYSRIIAVERQKARHENAMRLYETWRGRFPMGGMMQFVNADIKDRLELLEGVDCLVAKRVIYYLRDDLDAVFSAIAEHVPRVVLCGNKQRAGWVYEGLPDRKGGPVNYYASVEGMKDLLERHGYSITDEITKGDPIVAGVK